jgi:hypothetical protein
MRQFHKAAQKFTKKTFKVNKNVPSTFSALALGTKDRCTNKLSIHGHQLLKKFDSEFQGGARRAIRRQEQARRVKESQQFIQDVLEKFDRGTSWCASPDAGNRPSPDAGKHV